MVAQTRTTNNPSSEKRPRSGITTPNALKKIPGKIPSSLRRSKTMIIGDTCSASSSSSTTTSTPDELNTPTSSVSSSSVSTRPHGVRTRMNDEQRKQRLDDDPDVVPGSVQPRQVDCRGCKGTIRLDTKIKYGSSNWKTHKRRCQKLARKEDSDSAISITTTPCLTGKTLSLTSRSESPIGSSHQLEKLTALEYEAILGLLNIQRMMRPSMFS
ncbi:hypothetical protein FB446DRAFT_278515 [Lentinula raphanica]|nr:hypothetical protein FB446DRAFT_278515 [Lentinula raphanica]